jgi:hypothetical protein
MIFRTKLDELATRSKARNGTWHTGGPDIVSRWGPRCRGRCRGASHLLETAVLVPIKLEAILLH